ncbi:Pex19 protein, partial [Boletus edulis]|uniref:Pex19 protein n=1 Tax=Boletus edulis BED1 TaxID=1328754 RepID=A0AAD4BND0_BOLED
MDSDFTRQLSEGMASLFQELGIESGAGSEGTDGVKEQERQLAAAWEAMLVEGMNSASDPTASHARTPGDASSSGPPEADFQSSIRSTLDRLREKESKLQPPDSSASGDGENLQSLLSQLQGLGGLSGDDVESEDQLQGVLEEMMGQLMSKQVLYEPLKELYEKFPGYLTEHASTISPEDKTRYEAQISCIKQLIDEFKADTFSDEDATSRGKIVELMSELQTHGQPPEEIMGPLPPGFNMSADGLPEMPDGCNMN